MPIELATALFINYKILRARKEKTDRLGVTLTVISCRLWPPTHQVKMRPRADNSEQLPLARRSPNLPVDTHTIRTRQRTPISPSPKQEQQRSEESSRRQPLSPSLNSHSDIDRILVSG
jgi:hypothetical protein